MGKIRFDTIRQIQGSTISWICDINPKIDIPEGIKFTTDYDDILNDEKINAVVICASNNVIKDAVIAALSRKKHVFSEKPPGRNLEELNKIIKAEKEHPELKLMFGFNHRHHDSMLHAKKLIDSGEYGKILWVRGRYGKSVDNKFFFNWRASKEQAGGGILLDQGIHMLDLFLMLCGDFDEVKAYVSNLYWKLDIEDNVFAILKNKEGQVASLHSTMTQWRHLFSLEIFMERGYITINGLKTPSNTYGDEVMSVAKNRTLPPAAIWTKEEDIVFHVDNSWKREIEIFISSIKNDREAPVGNTRDAFKVMNLIDKIYKQNK